MSTKLQQQGFVLVSVLLITSIATFFAFSAVGGIRVQERIAGNQLKQENARTLAEKGIIVTAKNIESLYSAGNEIDTIVSTLNGNNNASDYRFTIEREGFSNNLVINSKGNYHGDDATAYLNAHIGLRITSDIPTGSGIIACDGIKIVGSGSIDSYDSSKGAYQANSANSNANVVIVDGDFSSAGNTTIQGGITVNGEVHQTGNIQVHGDVNANGAVTMSQSAVLGNISSNDNITLTGVTVGQVGESAGNISSKETLTIGEGSVSYNGNGTGSVHAKQIDAASEALKNTFSTNRIEDANAATVEMSGSTCNAKNIESALPDSINPDTIHDNLNSVYGGTNRTLAFTPSTAQVTDPDDETNQVNISPTPLTSALWVGEKDVYVFDKLSLKNTTLNISGDIIIMVTGDVETTGDSSGFQFTQGDTNSSLTLLVEGQVNLASNSKIFSDAGISDKNAKIPLTIYSSYDNAPDLDTNNDGEADASSKPDAVTIGGGANMYAKVYAPLGNINYLGSGDMRGALEGRNVSIAGHASVHYDEALAQFEKPPEDATTSVHYSSLYYYYPPYE